MILTGIKYDQIPSLHLTSVDEFFLNTDTYIELFNEGVTDFSFPLNDPDAPWGEIGSLRTFNKQNIVDSTLRFSKGKAYHLSDLTIVPEKKSLVKDDKFLILDYLYSNHEAYLTSHCKVDVVIGHSNESLFFLDTLPVTSFDSIAFDFSSDQADKNPFHFLMRCIPKLKFLDHIANDTLPLIFFYEPTDFQLQTLSMLNLRNPISILDSGGRYKFKSLISVEIPWEFHNKGVLGYVRDRVLASLPSDPTYKAFPKKLYIHRKGFSRLVLNREELETELESRSFYCTNLQGISLSETAELFKHAEIIVAEHGAASVFMMFARLSTRFIEIIPSRVVHFEFENQTVIDSFYWLANGLGNRNYTYHSFNVEDKAPTAWSEYYIDVTEILANVDGKIKQSTRNW